MHVRLSRLYEETQRSCLRNEDSQRSCPLQWNTLDRQICHAGAVCERPPLACMAGDNLLYHFLCFHYLHFHSLLQHTGRPDCVSHISDNCLHNTGSLYLSCHGEKDLLRGILCMHSARPFVSHGKLNGHVFICAGPCRRFASCEGLEAYTALTCFLLPKQHYSLNKLVNTISG